MVSVRLIKQLNDSFHCKIYKAKAPTETVGALYSPQENNVKRVLQNWERCAKDKMSRECAHQVFRPEVLLSLARYMVQEDISSWRVLHSTSPQESKYKTPSGSANK